MRVFLKWLATGSSLIGDTFPSCAHVRSGKLLNICKLKAGKLSSLINDTWLHMERWTKKNKQLLTETDTDSDSEGYTVDHTHMVEALTVAVISPKEKVLSKTSSRHKLVAHQCQEKLRLKAYIFWVLSCFSSNQLLQCQNERSSPKRYFKNRLFDTRSANLNPLFDTLWADVWAQIC